MAWLDHEEIRGEQVYQETKALASKNNGIPIVETIREIMTRVHQEIDILSREYIL
jgi:hypothetical protein